MKVLHFYKTHKPDTIGGVEQFVDQVAKITAPLGVQTRVLAMSPHAADRPIRLEGYELFQSQSLVDYASTPMSFRAISDFAYHAAWADIIHLHYPYPFADLAYLLSHTTKPTLVTYHSDIVRQKAMALLYSPLKRMFLNRVDQIVATSQNYIDTSSTLKRFAHKTSVIPLGLSDRLGEPIASNLRDGWREKLGSRFFLFLGVLRYYKGLRDLVLAAKDAPYPVAIAGDGPERAELEQLAASIGADNVHFLGQVSGDEKCALLKNCSGFVFPSNLRSEAFGVSLIEAAMHEKPMITCEIGTGTSFVNLGNVTGLICPHSEPLALRSAMDRLWNDEETAVQFGQNARRRYLDHFTAERMVRSYFGAYEQLLHASTTAPLSVPEASVA